MTKKESSTKRKIFIIISFSILYIIFTELIWNKYIVNLTAWDALKEEPGRTGTRSEIDSNNMMAVLYPEKGFHVYLVSRGFWGWRINDEIAIQNEGTTEPFTARKTTLKLKGKGEIDIIIIVSQDKEINNFIAYDEIGEAYHFNRTFNQEANTYLYYTDSEEEIPGNLTYEAYSANDKLLYKE